MSQYDLVGLHEFLAHTPEKGIRKTLIDQNLFSEAHCSLLLKVAKTCTAEDFAEHFENQSFPKVRMTNKESLLKEKFWKDCEKILKERGILQPAPTGSQKIAA
ncbi:MAG TPA: hypothetical protein DCL41_10830 [Bdellovibrionales bacterium]|nr:hypothetical protein [Pseudobdellovibrionaceae bacterium]HAG92360.1 hypothetical protein [Bdellovibrionales bacterium]|tara:strand:+ start:3090 stop:3398 length:309 start_codon:yes stop_codon:yes gene_type:complete